MMKKIIKIAIIVLFAFSLTSCATVLGGKITSAQKTKPSSGQREIRVGALVADIFFFLPGLIIDFATGAIYKPNN